MIISGCGETLSSGKVIDKKHEDMRTYMDYNLCAYSDKDGCHGAFQQKIDDEDWMIKLENCKEASDGGGTPKCKRQWIKVDSLRWKEIEVGDIYDKEN